MPPPPGTTSVNATTKSAGPTRRRRCFHTVLNRFALGSTSQRRPPSWRSITTPARSSRWRPPVRDAARRMPPSDTDKQRAYYYRAMCLHQLNRAREAIKAYRNVIDARTKMAPRLLHRARLAIAHLLHREGKDRRTSLAMFEELVEDSDQQSRCAARPPSTPASWPPRSANRPRLRALPRRWCSDPGDGILAPARPGRPDVQPLRGQEIPRGARASSAVARPPPRVPPRAAARCSPPSPTCSSVAMPRRSSCSARSSVPSPTSDLAFDAAYNRLLCFYQIDGTHVDEQADAFLQIYGRPGPATPADPHRPADEGRNTVRPRRNFREAAETYSEVDATLVSDCQPARPALSSAAGASPPPATSRAPSARCLEVHRDYPRMTRIPEALAKRAEARIENGNPAAALQATSISRSNQSPAQTRRLRLAEIRPHVQGRGRPQGDDPPLSSMLDKVPGLDAEVVANASYWIGWGHFKTDKQKEAVQWLRNPANSTTRPTVSRPASCWCWPVLDPGHRRTGHRDRPGLRRAATSNTSRNRPALDRHPGLQCRPLRGRRAVPQPGRHPEEPRQTPKVVWRYLGKAHLETSEAKEALNRHGTRARSRGATDLDRRCPAGQKSARCGCWNAAEKPSRPATKASPCARRAASAAAFASPSATPRLAARQLEGAIRPLRVVAELVEDKELAAQGTRRN